MVDRIRRKIKAGEEPTWEDILNVLENHESALHDFARSVRWVLRGMALVFVVGVAFNTYLYVQNIKRTREIQDERVTSVLSSCVDQNARHDGTVEALDRVVLQSLTRRPIDRSVPYRVVKVELRNALADANPTTREASVQGRNLTIFLINAIVPKQNCRVRVERVVPSAGR